MLKVIKFWNDSPNDVSSPTLAVIEPAVVGETFAPPVATSTPKLNNQEQLDESSVTWPTKPS